LWCKYIEEDMTKKSLSIRAATNLVKAGQNAVTHKWGFLAIFLVVFLLTITVAASFDVLPNPIVAKASEQVKAPAHNSQPLVVAPSAPELPTKIEIPAISLSVAISNPESTNVEVLDNALLSGAVRYPSSSELGVPGTVILFGHSSYLPIVHNPAFKAFDGIQKLTQGDRITVTGSGHTYVYSVDTVRKASTTADSISLTTTGSTLTLATCNSFGQKTDRFIVSATLVETDAIVAQGNSAAAQ
jgi:LPXTG-site transpeptidase (sortase) family protein